MKDKEVLIKWVENGEWWISIMDTNNRQIAAIQFDKEGREQFTALLKFCEISVKEL